MHLSELPCHDAEDILVNCSAAGFGPPPTFPVNLSIQGGTVAGNVTLLGVGLVVATFFQVKFGLRPLRAIERGLTSIRSGKAENLQGEFPVEIEPLQKELEET